MSAKRRKRAHGHGGQHSIDRPDEAVEERHEHAKKGFFSSRLYWLLVFVPLSSALELLGMPKLWLFVTSGLALVPLASLISNSTEEISEHTGPRIGGLLNATFGNAPELIIAIMAIRAGLLDVVKASISGSILGNVLLSPGLCMFLGGWHREKQVFNRTRAGQSSAMLLLAVVALVMPAVFDHSAFVSLRERGLRTEHLSLLVAGVLILTYLASQIFTMIKGHGPAQPPSEIQPRKGSIRRPMIVLAVATILAAWESELLVSGIDSVTRALGMTEFFVGVVVVSLLGNVAEQFSAINVAMKDRMDLAMSIATQSGIQIALFIAPVLVFVSLLLGHPLSLVFNTFEITGLAFGVIILSVVSLDGESNWVEGLQLIAVYLVLAVVFFFVPGK